MRKEGTIITPIVPKKNTVKRTRQSTKQKHTAWVNEKSATDDHDTRFRAAAQEAIDAFCGVVSDLSEFALTLFIYSLVSIHSQKDA